MKDEATRVVPTAREAKESELARYEFRRGADLLASFIYAATESPAYAGTISQTILKAFQSVAQLVTSVHAQMKVEFHQELGVITEDDCPICHFVRREDIIRLMAHRLDSVDMAVSIDGGPPVRRDLLLTLMGEITVTHRDLIQQGLITPTTGDIPWAITMETTKRLKASRPAQVPLADVARIRRAIDAAGSGS